MTVEDGFICLVIIAVLLYTGCVEENGVYQRMFTNARILGNPGEKTGVKLGETYLADGKAVTSIELKPKTGILVLTSLLNSFWTLEGL